MKILVFDTESDGLAYEATKIHVLSWTYDGNTYQSTNDYNKMRELLNEADLLVCHNAIRHDMPLLNRILETTLQYDKFADSLALSWYLHFERSRHGLATYGADYGVPKPKVDDWHNLTYEEYAHRCEEDVKINWKLWVSLRKKLEAIYGNENWSGIVEYLSFKMDCAREQEEVRWKLDVSKALGHLYDISKMYDEKEEQLRKVMPKVPTYTTYNKPKVMYKNDGTVSKLGLQWFQRLRTNGKPMTYNEPLRVISGYSEPNPQSTPQIKDWLFSLGWKPATFKYVRGGEGGERSIPQLRYPKNHPDEGHLCASVLRLKDKEPAIEVLEGVTVLSHRKAFFKAMLDEEHGGYLTASVDGLTNTLRFKHKKPLANIPGVDKPWGAEIRGCLIAPSDDYVLCGADMSSLESTTKRHYMVEYDPKYVEEMSKPGFDEHLDLAMHAGAITEEQMNQHKLGEVDLSSIRKVYKAANYSCIYGVGAKKFSRDMGVSMKEAASVIRSYWNRNFAVKKVSAAQYIKEVNGELWLQNPVSGFYHNLRFEKDTFSTLNQSTGVYCFDMWTREIRKQGIKFCGQFHDEHITPVKKGDEEKIEKIYTEALDKLNRVPILRVPLGMEAEFGETYADVH